jgi:ParB family transcriptional regulator, chromosome partitioning protein
MTLKKFLEEKNANIKSGASMLDRDKGAETDSGAQRRASRTAPGALLGFNAEMMEAERREQALLDRLADFEGALPVKRLMPGEMRLSKWANRSEESFAGVGFETLKREIADAGENVQPIKVRPIAGEGGVKYELAYGQRRWRACAELGLTVNAIVQELTDQELFLTMDRENRGRADLSPYELGLHYERALKTKLWPSQNVLAKEVGVSQAYVSKLLALAALPSEIIGAFASVLELQAGWGPALARRVDADRAGVLAEANRLGKAGRVSSKQVYMRLMGLESDATVSVEVRGRVVAHYSDRKGQVTIRFGRKVLSAAQQEAIPQWIERLLTGDEKAL